MRLARLLCLLAFLPLLPACGVQRTISITTEPPGALVWVNDREIGRSPVKTEFLHYGTYDVRLELEGYEPVSTSGKADPPWWDLPGPDFFAELTPGHPQSRVEWHYELEPIQHAPEALTGRARDLREYMTGEDGTGEPSVPADEASEPK